MNIIKNRRIGIHFAVIMLWHPKGGYYSAIEEIWQKPSLCGASKRKEIGQQDVSRWHLRFPIWFSIKQKDGRRCYPVATWALVRVHRYFNPPKEYSAEKVWELGRGTQ